MKYDLSKLPAKTRDQILGSPKWIKLFSSFPDKLLGVGGDAKTVKGEKLGFFTAILYLTPAIRHLDPSGVIVALYAKGKAKTDTSGFVV